MNEKRVILVIEDERTISNFICRALNANDYKSIPAFSGKEGLSLFLSHSPVLQGTCLKVTVCERYSTAPL